MRQVILRISALLTLSTLVAAFVLASLPTLSADAANPTPSASATTGAQSKKGTATTTGTGTNNPGSCQTGGYLDPANVAPCINPNNPAYPWIGDVWKWSLGVVDAFAVIVLIAMAFANILYPVQQLETYRIRQLLPTFIWGIVLANLSMLICRAVVSVSDMLMGGGVTGGSFTSGNILTSLYQAWGINVQKLEVGIIPAKFSEIRPEPGPMLYALLISTALVYLPLIGMAILAFIFYLRFAIIFFFTAISPLAFGALIFPLTRPYLKQWWDMFWKWTFGGVASYLLLFVAAQVKGGSSNTVAGTSAGGTLIDIIPYAIALFLVYMAIQAPFKLGGALAAGWANLGRTGLRKGWSGASTATKFGAEKAARGAKLLSSKALNKSLSAREDLEKKLADAQTDGSSQAKIRGIRARLALAKAATWSAQRGHGFTHWSQNVEEARKARTEMHDTEMKIAGNQSTARQNTLRQYLGDEQAFLYLRKVATDSMKDVYTMDEMATKLNPHKQKIDSLSDDEKRRLVAGDKKALKDINERLKRTPGAQQISATDMAFISAGMARTAYIASRQRTTQSAGHYDDVIDDLFHRPRRSTPVTPTPPGTTPPAGPSPYAVPKTEWGNLGAKDSGQTFTNAMPSTKAAAINAAVAQLKQLGADRGVEMAGTDGVLHDAAQMLVDGKDLGEIKGRLDFHPNLQLLLGKPDLDTALRGMKQEFSSYGRMLSNPIDLDQAVTVSAQAAIGQVKTENNGNLDPTKLKAQLQTMNHEAAEHLKKLDLDAGSVQVNKDSILKLNPTFKAQVEQGKIQYNADTAKKALHEVMAGSDKAVKNIESQWQATNTQVSAPKDVKVPKTKLQARIAYSMATKGVTDPKKQVDQIIRNLDSQDKDLQEAMRHAITADFDPTHVQKTKDIVAQHNPAAAAKITDAATAKEWTTKLLEASRAAQAVIKDEITQGKSVSQAFETLGNLT